jgi:hypothetical protein
MKISVGKKREEERKSMKWVRQGRRKEEYQR